MPSVYKHFLLTRVVYILEAHSGSRQGKWGVLNSHVHAGYVNIALCPPPFSPPLTHTLLAETFLGSFPLTALGEGERFVSYR